MTLKYGLCKPLIVSVLLKYPNRGSFNDYLRKLRKADSRKTIIFGLIELYLRNGTTYTYNPGLIIFSYFFDHAGIYESLFGLRSSRKKFA